MLRKLLKKLRIKKNASAGISGSFVIRSYKAGTKELIYESPRYHNLVVSSDGRGRNIVLRNLAGDTTYPIEIDNASIGTGNNTPADGDTDLETPEVEDIVVADYSISGNDLIMSFFIPDGNLPNDTYTEFGMFCGTRLFARALIDPSYTKGSNQDTTIEYTITLSAV